jgi:hypothetical protein
MPRLSKEKQQQLVLVFLLTLAAIVGLYFSLINIQQEKLAGMPRRIEKAKRYLEKMRHSIQSAKQIQADLESASAKLAEVEAGMATGDLNAWLYSTIRTFKQNYKVDIPQFSSKEVGEVTLLPNFPYKQVKIGIGGSAQFYELGRFLRDFENTFPCMRVQNLAISQEGGHSAAPADREKLSFRLEIVGLVKPGSE